MNSSKSSHIYGIVGTIIFHAIILVILFSVGLVYPPAEKTEWPPKDSSEILFGGEYVMLEDVIMAESDESLSDEPSENSTDEAEDMTDEGIEGEPSSIITSEQESVMKKENDKQPEQSGPTKEELAQKEKENREKEASEKINNQVKFGGKGNGKSELTNSNSQSGINTDAPGHTLSGRTMEKWGKPRSTKSGSIIVRVIVARDGKVIKAEAINGKGPAYADRSIRRRCEQASLNDCRFSVDQNAKKEQQGIITWHFK